jgi:DNA sulfur modification protein DndB
MAGNEYYVAMWTYRQLLRRASFDDHDVPAELRAQRTLNKARIPEIATYILQNPTDYVFSALTASIDARVRFEPYPNETTLGTLNLPDEARIIINDGQHRRAAIKVALEEKPELAHETIAVVLFVDLGLARCQQMFSDLNRYAIRPSRSIGLLYDHRDEGAKLARMIVMNSGFFHNLVDMEKSSLSPRSRKLFTLSAFYNASAELIRNIATGDLEQDAKLARDFWEALAACFPSWGQVREGRMLASEVREGFIHSYAIGLQAIGVAGNALLRTHPQKWRSRLSTLEKLDWSRDAGQWEGRAVAGGHMSRTSAHVTLTANLIKQTLGLALTIEEKAIEDSRSKALREQKR